MTTMTAIQSKRCVKCGTDVTGAQRMKDSKGQYWCMDCGGKDAANKSTSLISPCPKCEQPTHAHNLVRHNGTYVCETCSTSGKGGSRSKGDTGGRTKMIIGAVAVVALGALYYVMNVAG